MAPAPVPPVDTPPGPVWQWTLPEEPRGPTVGGLIRGAFRLYGAAFSSLFGLALVQQAIQVVLWIPIFMIMSRAFTKMIDLFEHTTFPRGASYTENLAFQEQFQAQIQAAFTPEPWLAALNALTSGLGVPVALVFLAVFTAIGLAAHDGRSDSVSDAIRLVSARLTSFLVPGVILGLCVMILSLPYGFGQGLSGTGRTPEGARLGLLLSGLSILVLIAVIYFVVRWSLAIPAMLAEGIGVRAGLRRSSDLTTGMRLRIFGAILAVVLTFLVVELIGLIVALVIGLSTGSIAIGVATGAVLWLAIVVALAPFFPALTVVAYRDRVPAQAETAAPAAAEAAIPG
jgi:Membrane domain of glycerophosphoryl diester phosphodiesterase